MKDVKKFVFYYWFAFPAFSWPSSVGLRANSSSSSFSTPLKDILSEAEVTSLETVFQESTDYHGKMYFLICLNQQSDSQGDQEERHRVILHSIQKYKEALATYKRVWITFADASTSADIPGWPLRNILSMIAMKYLELDTKESSSLEVVSLRMKGNCIAEHSRMYQIEIGKDEKKPSPSLMPPVVGWEKNARGKLLPRIVDMSNSLDPAKMAQNAVNLNLKLMRWRLIPSLNLERIAQTKCLLLGAGTLGCNVSRALLGWGVETITLIDNSKVSFSNPVRQSLFNFRDCLNGGTSKAEAAAASLQLIYPNVKSVGHTLSIPMPGHFVGEESKETFDKWKFYVSE